MDGIEWTRAKWGPVAKIWFWLNDWAGCWLGDHLIADHPQIAAHLETRVSAHKITTIPYGADNIISAPEELVRQLGLEPGRYLTLISRAEPENSILEVVRGFSKIRRCMQLVILGPYQDSNPYHRAVKAAAGPDVVFVGPIYQKEVVQALRFHCAAYIHGHQVGGTNPSLVEALGAGNPVIAHDNRFNRWVAGTDTVFFSGADSFSDGIGSLLEEPARLARMSASSRERHREAFSWPGVLARYENLLERHLPAEELRRRI